MEDNLLEDIYSEFRHLLKKHFSDLFFRHTSYAGSDYYAELATENKLLTGTPYFYGGDLSFIHWTSINNLLSILNNREIRLYNLYNSEDKDEFDHAAITLGLNSKEIEFAKNHYFAFSFCKKEDLTNYYLWEQYGKNYSGVAIEFSIKNNPSDWDNYMMSNIHYELPKNFIEFEKDISILKKKYGVTFKLNIGNLIGFHKRNEFHNEKEVRIATYFPYKNFEENLKFEKTEFRIDVKNKRNRITNYIGLPLWVENKSSYLKSEKPELDRRSYYNDDYFLSRPKIKIMKIYFGKNCGIDFNEFGKYRSKISDIIQFNFGYKADVDWNFFR